MYSSNTDLAKKVCKDLGWVSSVHPLEAMTRKGKVYIRGTALKPDEARELEQHCEDRGYVYKGPFTH